MRTGQVVLNRQPHLPLLVAVGFQTERDGLAPATSSDRFSAVRKCRYHSGPVNIPLLAS